MKKTAEDYLGQEVTEAVITVLASLLRSLALRVGEIGGNRDDSLRNLLSEDVYKRQAPSSCISRLAAASES